MVYALHHIPLHLDRQGIKLKFDYYLGFLPSLSRLCASMLTKSTGEKL